MSEPRRFKPPWKAVQTEGGHFQIVDADERPTGVFVYCADDYAGQAIGSAVASDFPTRDEARRIAKAIARLPDLLLAEKYRKAKGDE